MLLEEDEIVKYLLLISPILKSPVLTFLFLILNVCDINALNR